MSQQDYELDKILGRGAFGEVYRALHKKTRVHYAIKIVDFEETLDVRKLLSEVRTLSKLRSEYLNRYYQSFQEGTTMWIVLEFCAGGLCYDLIQTFKCVPEDVTAHIIKCVLLGVDYLHKENQIHRDIKLANVFITKDGHIKLGDFGVSGEISITQNCRKTVVGTPHWMAPEVIVPGNAGYDYRADLWSIGITTYELLIGQPPTARMLIGEALRSIPTNDPPKLQGYFQEQTKCFVERCLIKDPKFRPEAKQLLQHQYIRTCATDSRAVEYLLFRQQTAAGSKRKIKKRPVPAKPHVAAEPISWNFPPETIAAKPLLKTSTEEGDILNEACLRLHKRARCDSARHFVLQLRQLFLEGEQEHKGLSVGFLEEIFSVSYEFRAKRST